jgi:hypothetical protein
VPVPDRSLKNGEKESDNEMKTKAMAMFAVLMIALSVFGFVYAHWSDEIKINGEVHMGSLTFGFTEILLCEDGKMVDDVIVKPEPKEVGDVDCWLEEPETDVHSGKTVWKKLWINITNAYPDYVAQCNYTLDNGGTIPLDVVMYCVYGKDPYLTYLWYDTDADGLLDTIEGRNATGATVINIWFEPLFFGQIDPCNSVEQGIVIHLKQPAEECHTYEFEIVITARQWDP